MRWAVMWAVAATLVPTAALAHRDLAGDSHPRVEVIDGQFVIRFVNSMEGGRVYETVLAPNGDVVVERRATGEAGSFRPRALEARADGHEYVLEWEWLRREDPDERAYSLRHTFPFGRVERLELRWNDERSHVQVSELRAKAGALFLLTFASSDGRLRFDRFDGRGRHTGTVSVGEPASIREAPIVSSVAEYRGLFLVAWVGRPDEDRDAALNLAWFDPTTGVTGNVELARRIHSNTSVSLGVTGEDILVAYHGPAPWRREGPLPTGAVIQTVHRHGLPVQR